MSAAALAALEAIRASWGPARMRRVGAFDVPEDAAGGRRACAIRHRHPGAPVDAAELEAALGAKPGGHVVTVDGTEDALAAALGARGLRDEAESVLMEGPVRPLLDPLPPVSGMAHWPPVALLEEMWLAHGQSAAHLGVAARAPEPKAAILLRARDRAAGGLFVCVVGDRAALHMVLTLPEHRRAGVGLLGMTHAAHFARAHGARSLVLPVEAANDAARALYARAGLREVGRYRYWRQGDRA